MIRIIISFSLFLSFFFLIIKSFFWCLLLASELGGFPACLPSHILPFSAALGFVGCWVGGRLLGPSMLLKPSGVGCPSRRTWQAHTHQTLPESS